MFSTRRSGKSVNTPREVPIAPASAPRSSATAPQNQRLEQPQSQQRQRRYRHSVTKVTVPATNRAVQDSLLHVRLRAQDSIGLALSCPNEECVICAECFATDDVVTVLPCGHMHHSNCILNWLCRQCTCPTCRFDLATHAAGESQPRLQGDMMPHMPVLPPSPSAGEAIYQQKSANFDLIMRRTLRMRKEARELEKQHDTETDDESTADTVSSAGSTLRPDVDHAHFLEIYAGIPGDV